MQRAWVDYLVGQGDSCVVGAPGANCSDLLSAPFPLSLACVTPASARLSGAAVVQDHRCDLELRREPARRPRGPCRGCPRGASTRHRPSRATARGADRSRRALEPRAVAGGSTQKTRTRPLALTVSRNLTPDSGPRIATDPRRPDTRNPTGRGVGRPASTGPAMPGRWPSPTGPVPIPRGRSITLPVRTYSSDASGPRSGKHPRSGSGGARTFVVDTWAGVRGYYSSRRSRRPKSRREACETGRTRHPASDGRRTSVGTVQPWLADVGPANPAPGTWPAARQPAPGTLPAWRQSGPSRQPGLAPYGPRRWGRTPLGPDPVGQALRVDGRSPGLTSQAR
jgi:hypothetical protein